jgi:hypothetical protein
MEVGQQSQPPGLSQQKFSAWSAAFTRVHAASPFVTAGRLKLFENARKPGWRSDLKVALPVKMRIAAHPGCGGKGGKVQDKIIC